MTVTVYQLNSWNRKFLESADNVRWHDANGRWFMRRPKGFTPRKFFPVRSCLNKDGSHLMVLDFDGELTPAVWSAVVDIYSVSKRQHPLIKSTKSGGVHVIFWVSFPEGYTDHEKTRSMTNLTYALHCKLDMAGRGITFGGKKPTLDPAATRATQMVRGFGRCPDGTFTVPLSPIDPFDTAKDKIAGRAGAGWVLVPRRPNAHRPQHITNIMAGDPPTPPPSLKKEHPPG